MTVEIFAEAHQSQLFSSGWELWLLLKRINVEMKVKSVARCCDRESLRCLGRRVFGLCKRGYSFKNFWVRNKNPGRSPKLHNQQELVPLAQARRSCIHA